MASALELKLADAQEHSNPAPAFALVPAGAAVLRRYAMPGAFRRIGIVLGGSFEGERLSARPRSALQRLAVRSTVVES